MSRNGYDKNEYFILTEFSFATINGCWFLARTYTEIVTVAFTRIDDTGTKVGYRKTNKKNIPSTHLNPKE